MNTEKYDDFEMEDDVVLNDTETDIHLIIPEGTTSISMNTFLSFRGVTTISIPRSLVDIGAGAFKDANYLSQIFYGGTIEDWCHIKFANIWSNPMAYEREIFMLNDSDEYYLVENLDVVIPDTVVDTSYIFCGFNGLRSVTCPDTLRTIGIDTFSHSDVKSVYVGNSVTIIEDHAFNDCAELENIELGQNVQYIKGGAFANCFHLRSLCFNDKVRYISSSAFYSSDNIDKIFVPKGVYKIPNREVVGFYAKVFYEGSIEDTTFCDREQNIYCNCTKEMFDEYGKV